MANVKVLKQYWNEWELLHFRGMLFIRGKYVAAFCTDGRREQYLPLPEREQRWVRSEWIDELTTQNTCRSHSNENIVLLNPSAEFQAAFRGDVRFPSPIRLSDVYSGTNNQINTDELNKFFSFENAEWIHRLNSMTSQLRMTSGGTWEEDQKNASSIYRQGVRLIRLYRLDKKQLTDDEIKFVETPTGQSWSRDPKGVYRYRDRVIPESVFREQKPKEEAELERKTFNPSGCLPFGLEDDDDMEDDSNDKKLQDTQKATESARKQMALEKAQLEQEEAEFELAEIRRRKADFEARKAQAAKV